LHMVWASCFCMWIQLTSYFKKLLLTISGFGALFGNRLTVSLDSQLYSINLFF
jgi:hypothetical protein